MLQTKHSLINKQFFKNGNGTIVGVIKKIKDEDYLPQYEDYLKFKIPKSKSDFAILRDSKWNSISVG